MNDADFTKLISDIDSALKKLPTKDDLAKWVIYIAIAVIFCGVVTIWSFLR